MPEIVLMDVRMPILDGIQATTRRVESGKSSRILILTAFGLDEHALGALRAGASGFVLEHITATALRVSRRQ
jgi:DNA-binding NarL/FixJ family response regulator